MAIKMILSDETPKNRRRKSAASGAFNAVPSQKRYAISSGSDNSRYAKSTTASVPITKNAQFAGSAANAIWAQPMFFSPLHTPQNWQIASKRREIYQWLYLSYSQVLTIDFTYKNIKDISFLNNGRITDTLTGGYLYPDIDSELILGASGDFRKPSHFSERECFDKTCFEFNAQGYYRTLAVSEEHPIIILDGKLYRHKTKLQRDGAWRKSMGIKEGTKKIKISNDLICRKEARDVSPIDYLLSPIPKCNNISVDSDLAWSIGLCIADGTIPKNGYGTRFTHAKNEDYVPMLEEVLATQFTGKIGSRAHGEGNGWSTCVSTKESYDLYSSYIDGKLTKKKFRSKVFELDKESRLHLLGGYLDGDGSFDKKLGKIIANNYSCDMADQIYWLLLSCDIVCSLNKVPLYGEHYKTVSTCCYRIIIPSSEVPKVSSYMRSNKIPVDFIPKKQRQLRFLYEEKGISYVAQPIDKIRKFKYTGKGYDIQVDPERAFVASGYISSNCRFYYATEPKVAAGVDFYSSFPLNGFKLECKKKKILKYFEKIAEDIDLAERLNEISFEYFLMGDVFPFLEIDCPVCHGKGRTPDGELCNHADGKFKNIKILNPDYVDVKTNNITNTPKYYLIPDEELRMLVQRREPRELYESLSTELLQLIASGLPIPLSDRCVTHIKHHGSPYGTFGSSFLQRLFTILAYKTKLMTANWIIAERLILPVRIVKVGDKDRPAQAEDLQDVVNQLAAVANDPNLTIVTHHAFEYEWAGPAGKIQNITQEIEQIGKEILDGLMLNQSILNGDAASYASAQVGVEILIRRLENWRNKLKHWVEKHIFLPIAMMQGFVDEEESKILGETIYLYPRLTWNDLQLRDKSNRIQTMLQLYDKKLVSGQTILEELNLDYDSEIEKLRDEQISAAPSGMIPGGAGLGGIGSMGMGGAPGGMGQPIGGMGVAPGGMGQPMGGGAPVGGGPSAGGLNTPMASGTLPKITKKGKGQKPEEMPIPKMIKFTKLEQKMYKILKELNASQKLFAQYSVSLPGEERPFVLDFAYPEVGVGVESDGAIWHQNEEFKMRDSIRDQKLANVGWRILRFRDDAVEESPDAVQDIISQNIVEAQKSKKHKKAEIEGDEVIKTAAINEEGDVNSVYLEMMRNPEKIAVRMELLPDNLGELFLIGTEE